MKAISAVTILAGAALIGVGGGALLSNVEPQQAASASTGSQAQAPRTFTLCGSGARINCVVDGDTLWMDGEKIRVADIDTPEVTSPQCATERALGQQATSRLLSLVNAGPFELRQVGDRDTDPYGRKLRVLVRAGHSLGDQLVSEGLARTWSGRREPWC